MTNSIHPTAVIEGDVTLGRGNTVGPFVTITGPVSIGDDNWIGAGVVLGAPPEVRGFAHPKSASTAAGGGLVIGSHNVLREYVQVHQGWKNTTTLGDHLFVMNQVYIAHDCEIADAATLASSVLLAGHVAIGQGANLGLGVAVHQRRRVGEGAMVGMGSVVTRDIPPFATAYGSPARVRGANRVGMERSGFPPSTINAVTDVYGTEPVDLTALRARADLVRHFHEW